MAEGLISAVRHALLITGFVFMMMLVVEYFNVLARGSWQQKLMSGHRWEQYIVAALLGVTPGCLGAFAVVAMYSHGVLSLGAVVAAMIATSGDEAYVILELVPKQGLFLFGILFLLGIAAGMLTDGLFSGERAKPATPPHAFELHDMEECECYSRGRILHQWMECSPQRGILSVVLAILIFALATGWVGPSEWNWVRITALLTSLFALFIICTVPDHFLEEHLWVHVARKHTPRVFLWTLGALVLMYFLTDRLNLDEAIRGGKWVVLFMACLVGLIPESGPHLIFVTLYAQGTVPFSVLLASSIVQDGHGMLPMLAHSRRAFVQIKWINFIVGLLCGVLTMAVGI